jgi:hypothetical protein
MINCIYNENNKYYNVNIRNNINVSELINATRKCTKHNGNNNVKIMADFRKSNIEISEQEIDIIREQIMKYNSEIKIRAAIIQEDPILTAYTMLFLDNLNLPKVNIKLFSTNEAAEDWLLEFE